MKTPERKCGDCTACCEGWLHGVAHGKSFYPGKPCHFLGCKGCTIYSQRPKDPCVDFKCTWLAETILPEWFRPDQSNVIIERLKWGPNKDKDYFKVTERGVKIDATVLNWCIQNLTPLKIQIDRGWNYFGPQEFANEVMK